MELVQYEYELLLALLVLVPVRVSVGDEDEDVGDCVGELRGLTLPLGPLAVP